MNLNKLILLDFPNGYKLGIDLREWTVGPNFKGIKEIPDGPHYVYYGSNEQSYNIGFLLHMSKGEVVVKRWSNQIEDFEDLVLNEEDVSRYESNMQEIDRYLGKYVMDNHIDWWSISDNISPAVLKNVMPDCGRIYSVEQFLSKSSSIEDRKNTIPKIDKDGLVELEVDPRAQIHFTKIPKYLFPEGSLDRTKYVMDKTFTLEKVLSSTELYRKNPKQFLGEFQFAFITYNLGFVLSSFEQWLSILDLLCNCVEAITKYPDLYSSFLSIIHHQLQLTDEDFSDILTMKNKFYLSMKNLFNIILDETNLTDDLKIKCRGLKSSMSTKYEWNFDVDVDDEQPLLVDLCE